MQLRVNSFLFCLITFLALCVYAQSLDLFNDSISENDAYNIGIQVYHFFYPLVLMDITRKVMTNYVKDTGKGVGPMNMFCSLYSFPTYPFTTVVMPNFDTLYSNAWLDLSEEPQIISVPNTNDRYYMLEMLDMWTDVIAVPGKQTTGTNATSFIVVQNGWSGTVPDGLDVIVSTTPYLWVLGRTQTNGEADYAEVNEIQNQYKVTSLSEWLGTKNDTTNNVVDTSIDMTTAPVNQVDNMGAAEFFNYASKLLNVNTPHITDWPIIKLLQQIGITIGQEFDYSSASLDVQVALNRSIVDGFYLMEKESLTIGTVVNNWKINRDCIGVYGNNYLKRAITAWRGLGANQPTDAIYPIASSDEDGTQLNGENNYTLHFKLDEIPPVNAFWSLTMYDTNGFPVDNQIDRYAIGDRDALEYNDDGSLDIYVQYDPPGADKESNWLPSAAGNFFVTMRLYSPKITAIYGLWNPPAIIKNI